MKSQRMSKLSAANVRIARSAHIHRERFERKRVLYLVCVQSEFGHCTYLHGSTDLMEYPTITLAKRALKRLNPEIAITVEVEECPY